MSATTALLLGGASLPPVPSRAAVCGVRLDFSGTIVVTRQYGRLPWYDMALFCLLDPADRAAVYAAKHAARSTHCLMSFDPDEGTHVNRLGVYDDIIIPYSHMLHPETMVRDTTEVLQNGFTPIVNLGCDREDGVPYFQNAVDRYRALVACLGRDALMRYVLTIPGWDGTFYGWEPEEITEFGRIVRDVCPHAYLGIEHDPGHIPVGGGAEDYNPVTGRMRDYDVVLSEFRMPFAPDDGDQLWQVALRLLGPAWVKPPDAPDYMTTEYAIHKWYLSQGSPRGPYFTCAFEWDGGTFRWVQVNPNDLEALQRVSADNQRERDYFVAAGYAYTG